MNHFIRKYEENTIGVLSGLDRLVLRGTLRSLAFTGTTTGSIPASVSCMRGFKAGFLLGSRFA